MSNPPPFERITLHYPVWPERTMPLGFLVAEPACQACWYYYTIAMRLRETVGKSTDDQILEYKVGASIMEMPMWMDNRHHSQAKSVATMYGLASPDEMFKHWPSVRLQAAKENFPRPDDAILNPKEDRIT